LSKERNSKKKDWIKVDNKAEELFMETTKYLANKRIEVYITIKDYNISYALHARYTGLMQLKEKFLKDLEKK
jgi:hypothetical protein